MTAAVALAIVASTTGLAVVKGVDLPDGRQFLGKSKCELVGRGRMTGPDEDCTPGRQAGSLSVKVVCRHRDRADVRDLRKEIISDYGLSDFHGELDHRVPHFLGGTDTKANLWPEPGRIPNAKDRLEFYVHDRVCNDRTMTPRYAVKLFLGDWRTAYRRYGLSAKSSLAGRHD